MRKEAVIIIHQDNGLPLIPTFSPKGEKESKRAWLTNWHGIRAPSPPSGERVGVRGQAGLLASIVRHDDALPLHLKVLHYVQRRHALYVELLVVPPRPVQLVCENSPRGLSTRS